MLMPLERWSPHVAVRALARAARDDVRARGARVRAAPPATASAGGDVSALALEGIGKRIGGVTINRGGGDRAGGRDARAPGLAAVQLADRRRAPRRGPAPRAPARDGGGGAARALPAAA